jgi:hypothetical protein
MQGDHEFPNYQLEEDTQGISDLFSEGFGRD